jgi:hypothetical protein
MLHSIGTPVSKLEANEKWLKQHMAEGSIVDISHLDMSCPHCESVDLDWDDGSLEGNELAEVLGVKTELDTGNPKEMGFYCRYCAHEDETILSLRDLQLIALKTVGKWGGRMYLCSSFGPHFGGPCGEKNNASFSVVVGVLTQWTKNLAEGTGGTDTWRYRFAINCTSEKITYQFIGLPKKALEWLTSLS